MLPQFLKFGWVPTLSDGCDHQLRHRAQIAENEREDHAHQHPVHGGWSGVLLVPVGGLLQPRPRLHVPDGRRYGGLTEAFSHMNTLQLPTLWVAIFSSLMMLGGRCCQFGIHVRSSALHLQL